MVKIKYSIQDQMLTRIASNWISHAFLVVIQDGTKTLGNSLAVFII